MKKILIVTANYYNDISLGLLNSAKKNLPRNFNIKIIKVPGVFEIPVTISKHLKKLINSIKKGYKPYVLFLTQIQGINNFRIAKDIDSNYFINYIEAKKAGVNFLAYRCKLNSKEIKIEKKNFLTNHSPMDNMVMNNKGYLPAVTTTITITDLTLRPPKFEK